MTFYLFLITLLWVGLVSVDGASSLKGAQVPFVTVESAGFTTFTALVNPPLHERKMTRRVSLRYKSLSHVNHMTKRILTTALVAVALAASTGITSAPAQAESFGYKGKRVHHAKTFKKKSFSKHRTSFAKKKTFVKHKSPHSGFHGSKKVHKKHPHKVKVNAYGQPLFKVSKLKQQALNACSYQLRHDAHAFGYKGASLKGADVKQVSKDKFVVYADAKLHDGYKLNHTNYNCTVKHGKVVEAYKPKKLKY